MLPRRPSDTMSKTGGSDIEATFHCSPLAGLRLITVTSGVPPFWPLVVLMVGRCAKYGLAGGSSAAEPWTVLCGGGIGTGGVGSLLCRLAGMRCGIDGAGFLGMLFTGFRSIADCELTCGGP